MQRCSTLDCGEGGGGVILTHGAGCPGEVAATMRAAGWSAGKGVPKRDALARRCRGLSFRFLYGGLKVR